MGLRRLVAALSIAAFGLICLTDDVGAAQRYASPTGSGTACTQASPCLLAEAVTKAKSGDEVIVGAGTYSVGTTLTPESPQVYVHGDLSGPMPRIVGTGMGNVPLGVPAAGGRLSYLDISHDGTNGYAAACNPGGTIDRVRLTANGSDAIALTVIQTCSVSDSLILASGTASRAIHGYGYLPAGGGGGAVLRNVTAIASGMESIGVDAEYTEFLVPGSFTLTLGNSIVSGEAADLLARMKIGGPGHIAISNSNFDLATAEGVASVSGSANQTVPPLFVNAAAGDYREAAGSPTIDAGSNDGVGPTDLAGDPRNLGAAPDIGAYEYVPLASPPPPGLLQALALKPKTFRTLRAGGAITSKQSAPIGTRVTYALSAAATVSFEVERALAGRRVGKKCRKPTAANRDRKKCTRYKAQKPPFSHAGAAGQNSFKFSGRVGGKALRPGRYRLVARANGTVKRAVFRVVR